MFHLAPHASDWYSPVYHIRWRVGGVVTQRIANPCTPVRFRSEPPDFQITTPIRHSPPAGRDQAARAAIFMISKS